MMKKTIYSGTDEILGEHNDLEVICFQLGEHIPPKYLNSSQKVIVQSGLIAIYLEDLNGKKDIIDFIEPCDILRTKSKINNEKLLQTRGMALEDSEILVFLMK
jgi:CRP-like cAMP-binding protein